MKRDHTVTSEGRNNYERQDAFHLFTLPMVPSDIRDAIPQDWRRDDSVAITDLMPVRSRQPVDGHVGNARTEAGVWSTLVVVDVCQNSVREFDVGLILTPTLCTIHGC
jgi:hypothetical protein